jgi:hypothetical protein
MLRIVIEIDDDGRASTQITSEGGDAAAAYEAGQSEPLSAGPAPDFGSADFASLDAAVAAIMAPEAYGQGALAAAGSALHADEVGLSGPAEKSPPRRPQGPK